MNKIFGSILALFFSGFAFGGSPLRPNICPSGAELSQIARQGQYVVVPTIGTMLITRWSDPIPPTAEFEEAVIEGGAIECVYFSSRRFSLKTTSFNNWQPVFFGNNWINIGGVLTCSTLRFPILRESCYFYRN
jgi:hypothetical protein